MTVGNIGMWHRKMFGSTCGKMPQDICLIKTEKHDIEMDIRQAGGIHRPAIPLASIADCGDLD